MIDDHTNAGNSLKALASQQGIDVPAQLEDKDRDQREKLTGKKGLDFDRDYMEAMVDGHQNLVDKLESRIDKTKLSEWKTSMGDRMTGHDGTDAKVKAEAIIPETSDNPSTVAVNQWAATTYPVAYSHLQAAKALVNTLKKRSTN